MTNEFRIGAPVPELPETTSAGPIRGLMMDYQLTVPAILRRAESLSGHVEIVGRRADGSLHRYTYRDMIRRAKQLAVALARLGVRQGDRVATLAWNHTQHLESYFGIAASGPVLHTLNVRLHVDDLAYIIEHAGDQVLLVDRDLLRLYEQLAPRIGVRHVIVFDGGPDLPAGTRDYEDFLRGGSADAFVFPELDEHAAASMCYSSGTTGRPKGVLYSHRALALLAMNWTAADVVGVRSRDVIMAVVPMSHINAWGLPFTAAHVGAKLVLPGAQLGPADLLDLIERERVTVTAGVPTVWSSVLRMLDASPDAFDIGSLRTIVVGGSAVSGALVRGYLERHHVTLMQAWGMTETTSLTTICALPPNVEHLPVAEQYEWRTRQGLPLPFVEIRARGENGLVPWNGATPGELEVRGPAVSSGYYGANGDRSGFTADGWLKTGDIVTIDVSGCMQIRDRAKDLIKSGGEWISSVALENALMDHPAVCEAAVIGVPDVRWDERPLAVIVLKTGLNASPDDLRAHLSTRVAKWWLPDAYEFVPEIPKTATGKFLKTALRDRYRNGVLTKAPAAEPTGV
jgi:fatty-acyl-CoA synthase